MSTQRPFQPSPSMVVAMVALFVALGGGAYAGVALNQVRSVHIKNGEVKNSDLASGAVSSVKIRNGAVSDPKIASLSGAKVVGPVGSAQNAERLNGVTAGDLRAETSALIGTRATRDRTDVLGPSAAEWSQPALVTTTNIANCTGNSTVNGVFAFVALGLPVGAQLLTVDTSVLDAAGPTSYSVEVHRRTLGTPTSSTTDAPIYSSGTLGGSTGIVHSVYTPSPAEIVQPSVDYYVRAGSFQNSANAFCQVSATYRLP